MEESPWSFFSPGICETRKPALISCIDRSGNWDSFCPARQTNHVCF
uniref:Uncharacterized protein n=1 Tax=Faecalibaculum rodentium TaxID=1702221 RepID=A0A140DVS3_9FIRM|nr:hypothetical protein AALO17_16160 [Faecalibaculum rodentium]